MAHPKRDPAADRCGREPTSRRSARLARWRVGLITGSVAAVTACATSAPPARVIDPVALQTTATVKTVARQISVIQDGNSLPQAGREAVIQRLKDQGGAVHLQRQMAAMSTLSDVDLHAGNQAQLLVDGPATFKSMFQAIEQAKRLVLLESYIIEDEGLAQQLAALLIKKRSEGVEVAVIYDAVGSIGTDGNYFQRLKDSQVGVCQFNPLNPLDLSSYGRITHRDHRKILVVDSEVGFTGGINISSVYSLGSSGRSRRGSSASGGGGGGTDPKNGWRDTQLKIQGPAVAALEDLFRETWQKQACQGQLSAAAPRTAKPGSKGPHVIRVVPASPDEAENRIYRLLLTAIDVSQRNVYLTMAYFAPGDDMVDALCEAAQRGVDVRLVLPSVSDFAPVLHAGRSHYERMLKAGVKLYELQDAVLHAKTAVIDGVVSTVGSSNMDWRSFASNSEVNAVVMGEDFGDSMNAMFQGDLKASKPILLEEWQRRSWWQRSKERLANLFERMW
ncbi:MAG: phospholipase D-like domain-containing protein [Pseudomonadota bacterium]